jgi:hypothetical protein
MTVETRRLTAKGNEEETEEEKEDEGKYLDFRNWEHVCGVD